MNNNQRYVLLDTETGELIQDHSAEAYINGRFVRMGNSFIPACKNIREVTIARIVFLACCPRRADGSIGLKTDKKPMSKTDVANLMNLNFKQAKEFFAECDDIGVFTYNNDGIQVNPRYFPTAGRMNRIGYIKIYKIPFKSLFYHTNPRSLANIGNLLKLIPILSPIDNSLVSSYEGLKSDNEIVYTSYTTLKSVFNPRCPSAATAKIQNLLNLEVPIKGGIQKVFVENKGIFYFNPSVISKISSYKKNFDYSMFLTK